MVTIFSTMGLAAFLSGVKTYPSDCFRRVLVGPTAAAAVFAGAMASGDAQTVTTPGGTFPAATYQGVAEGDLTAFLGIRFAAAPAGALRFAPPTAPASVSSTIPATSFGSPCPQTPSPIGVLSADEDCLFLNVFVPGAAISAGKNLPVMVFFHGCVFVDGSGSSYDPTDMVIQGNTIVITVNYRLGILGYTADAALSAQAGNGVSGNCGFQDQLFALKWVQQNIGAFGGNPHNVTIFGESAGAFSVCAAVVSPAGAGLFQRAISESGPCAFPLPTQAGAEDLGATIVTALGCSGATVACLRAVPVDQILAKQGNVLSVPGFSSIFDFFPNVDGVVIPEQPVLALALGKYNHVPVIQGTNHDEGRYEVAVAFDLNPAVGPLTAAEYRAAVEALAATFVTEEAGIVLTTATIASTGSSTSTATLVQLIAQEILNEYPLSNFANPDEALSAVIGDGAYSCQANIANEIFSLSVPTFGYEFNDENAPMLFLPPISFPYGATHTDELQFLFPFAPSLLSASEQQLATTMKSYWTNFARNGNPNGSGTAQCAAFNLLAGNVQSLIPPKPQIEFDFAKEHNCGFWIGILEQTILQSVASTLTAHGIVH
jgi:para-nitrobenzyl esterase